jgi:hypothetical protein
MSREPRRHATSVPLVRYVAPPTLRNTWPLFAFLIAAAALWFVFGKAVLVIAAIVFLLIGWVWFCRRWPMTALVIIGFLRGLLGGRR